MTYESSGQGERRDGLMIYGLATPHLPIYLFFLQRRTNQMTLQAQNQFVTYTHVIEGI